MSTALIPSNVPGKLSATIVEHTPQLVKLLPRDVELELFHAGLWLQFTTNKNLDKCTPTSLLRATIKAAMKGHVPGRDCHLLPFKRRPKGQAEYYEASMVEDYQGIVRALFRTGRVAWAKAEPVYGKDHFVCDELAELYEFQRYRGPLATRGKLDCYFSAIKLRDYDKPIVRVCTLDEVEKVRQNAPGGEQDAWLKWPEEMGRKTALKKQAKYMQLIPEDSDPAPAGPTEVQHQQNVIDLYGEPPVRLYGEPPVHAGIPEDGILVTDPDPDPNRDHWTQELLEELGAALRTQGHDAQWSPLQVWEWLKLPHPDATALEDIPVPRVRLMLKELTMIANRVADAQDAETHDDQPIAF